MKKFLVSFLCIMTLVAAMVMPAYANDGSTTMYTRWESNMYHDPDSSSAIVKKIPANQCISCWMDRVQGKFVECHDGEKGGWMLLSDLDVCINNNNGGSRNNSTDGTYEQTMIATGETAIRQKPDIKSSQLGTIHNGDQVYISTISSGWAKCLYNGISGYINADYVRYAEKSDNVDQSNNPGGWAVVYNYDDYMALNPDVAAVFKGNPAGAFNHFITYGVNECRQASINWNILEYALTHPDSVRRFGKNYRYYYEEACGLPIK